MLKNFILVSILLASSANLSHAVKNDFTGVYGGLSLGVASSNMHLGGGDIESKQKRSSQYGFILGAGKQMDNNIYYGLEVSSSKLSNMYRHIGNYNAQVDHQMSITPIIGWVCERCGFMPFVKAGYTRMGSHYNLLNSSGTLNTHGALLGFGVNYMATKNLNVRGEYALSRVYGNGFNSTFNALKLGIIYKFDTGTF